METINENQPREYDYFLIADQKLLYRLSDMGLLDRMHKVIRDKRDKTRRLWLFDKCDDTRDVITQWETEQAELAQ
jgi:hypothetical protein